MASMKSMKVAWKSLSKGSIAEAIAAETELKKGEVTKVLNSLAAVAAKEMKKGKFVIPGVCMIKTRTKPARG
jgi:nucleoid DNA-binding protein